MKKIRDENHPVNSFLRFAFSWQTIGVLWITATGLVWPAVSKPKVVIYAGAAIGSIALFCMASAYTRYLDGVDQKADFAVLCKTLWRAPEHNKAVLWLLTTIPPVGEKVLIPTEGLMYVQLTNLKETPWMVNSYAFEQELRPGKWSAIPQQDLRAGKVYFVSADFNRANNLEMMPASFDALLTDKHVEPHKTISGFVIFRTFETGSLPNIRLRIMDATGREMVAKVQMEQSIGQGIQLGEMKPHPPEDITAFRKVF